MRKTLFWIYAALVVLFVILKLYDSPLQRVEYLLYLRRLGYDNVNTRVFHTIKMCFDNIETAWAVKNLIGNTLPFLVLGVITKTTWKGCNQLKMFYYLSAALLALEILQYVLLLGTCDVDDVILNLTFLKIGFCLSK